MAGSEPEIESSHFTQVFIFHRRCYILVIRADLLDPDTDAIDQYGKLTALANSILGFLIIAAALLPWVMKTFWN